MPTRFGWLFRGVVADVTRPPGARSFEHVYPGRVIDRGASHSHTDRAIRLLHIKLMENTVFLRSTRRGMVIRALVLSASLASNVSAQDQHPCADPCGDGESGPSCVTNRGEPHVHGPWTERREIYGGSPTRPPRFETRSCTRIYTPLSVICMDGSTVLSNWVGFHEQTTCGAWS